MPRKPTDKMRRFAEGIVKGEFETMAAAYREIYSDRGSVRTTQNEASRLWRNPLVQAAAEAARREVDAQRRRRLAAERDRIRDRLWIEADSADRASDRIAALRLLGTQAGVDMFAQRIEVSPTESRATGAEVLADVEAMLERALGAEVESEKEEPPAPPPPLLAARAGKNPQHQNAQEITDLDNFPTPREDMPE